ncbi:MAG TPA: Ig-like domain-containing protein, partial [Elusimicrobiota bacterium]|nr:Ig-like domain-containing protein [Elusimicrobiota bacterium]
MKRLKTTAAYSFLGLIAALGAYAYSQSTLCAVVKLQIAQQATLEREAFDANLAVSNNLPTTPLTNFKVQIFFKDANGNAADSLFFVKIGTLTNINAIDGTGVVQSSSTADIDWLIIPSTGAGGTTPAGQVYAVSALITGMSNGVPQSVTTFNANITVQPQPAINLQYVLPYEVFADEPLTPIIEPIEPFPLGVRITNVGYGPANNFQINSAQPTIVDNKQGLALNVNILATVVSSQTIPNTLLIPFGNVPPNGVAQAQWIMSTTLSGRFISFTSTFTHAADLGGQLTSLIQNTTTYTLLHAVLVDLPGRDQTPDFLVNESMDRGAMQAVLDSGYQPPAEAILESDQPVPLPVSEIPGALSGTLSGTNGALTYRFTQGVSSNVWVHSYVPFPYGNTVALSYVARGDGKILNSNNAWISKHFDITTVSDIYWLNILDLTTTTNTYTVQFSSVGLDIPPAAVADLNAVTVSSGGAINLTWNAPGDGGNTGNILGGRYLVETVQSSTTALGPTFAQVDIATSTSPGNLENLVVPGLIGNATFFVYLWTQNTGGDISPISNGATVYTLPNPPNNLQFATVGSTYAAASWQIGNNNLPILYQVSAATAPGGVAVSSSPPQDSFTTSYVFGGLSPNTTFFFSGVGLSTSNSSSSPATPLGPLLTLAVPPSAVEIVVAGTGAVTAAWAPGLDPPGTQYLVELSSAPDLFPPTYSSGWLTGSTFTFTGVASQYLYSARVKARNSALIETPYTELGTAAFGSAISPAMGSGGSAFSISGANFGVYAGTASTRVQFGAGGPLATVTSWNDFKISGFVPVLSTGAYAVLIERQTAASSSTITAGTFTVGAVGTSSGPVVELSPFDGDEVTTSSPSIVASYMDVTAAISTASVRLAFDGVDVTTHSIVTASAATFVPVALLSEGTHTVTASVGDAAAYVSSASATFLVDTIPPDTSLTVDGLIDTSTAPVVVSTAAVGFSAFDAGSGAVDTVYVVDADFDACDFTNFISTAAPGTCANPYYDSPFTLSPGTHTISFYSDDDAGNSEDLNVVSILVLPAPSPVVLTLSPAAGSFVAESFPELAVLYVDSGAAIDTTSVRLALDGVDVTTQSEITASSATFDPDDAVADGTHTFTASAADFSGNVSSAAATFLVDTTPPATSLSIDSTTVAPGSFSITSTDTLSLAATDAGSGVSYTYYVIDADPFSPACDGVPLSTAAPNGTCANELYDGPFTLSAGTHTVYYFSEDNAGNQEDENVSSFTVSVPALASLAVVPSSAALSAGASVQFLAVGTFADGSTQTVTALWSSDAPSVATVTAGGLATGLSTGTAHVTASSGAIAGSATVTVSAPTVASLGAASIMPSSATTGAAFGASVAGTDFDSSAALSLEHFHVAGGTWATGGSLSSGRQVAASVLLHDGRVLTAGGADSSGNALASAELYDPVAGTWSPAAPLPAPL